MKKLFLFIIFFLVNAGLTINAQNRENTPPPTINVEAKYKVERTAATADEPGSERAETYFEYETTNADYVMVLGESDPYPPKGTIFSGGSKIFIAVGPGGIVSQAVAANLSWKPFVKANGIGGVVYSFDKEFNSDVFFRNSYKENFTSNKSQEEFARIAINTLQKMEYVAHTTSIKQGVITYTINFRKHNSLPEQEDIKRQIGFVVFAKDNFLYIMPMVKRNFPRDNRREWSDDPDALDFSTNIARNLAREIINAAR